MKKLGSHFVMIFLVVLLYMSAYADNTPPIARDDCFSIEKSKSKKLDILANDSDPDVGDKLTSVIISGPFHGSLTSNSDGTYTYTPATDYIGTDYFTYVVSDLSGDQSGAIVSLTVDNYIAGIIQINNLPVSKEIILNSNFWGDLTITTATGIFRQWHVPGIFLLTIKVDGQEIYKQLITIEIGMTTAVNIPPSSLLSILASSPCVVVENDLTLNLCVEHLGKKYGCTLNIQNLSELTWKLDSVTELQSDLENCISVGDDLKLDMCVEYQGKNYGFEMNYDNDLIWKMDLGTFKLKE